MLRTGLSGLSRSERRQNQKLIFVQYVEGIPEELNKYFKKNKRNLIMMDDLKDEALKSLKITQLFSCGRHDNFSVIYLMANLLHRNQCSLSLNSDYMVIFINHKENSQFPTIARWSSLCWLTKTQHHLCLPTWCLIWSQTLRKGFEL